MSESLTFKMKESQKPNKDQVEENFEFDEG
jgi:hypothetical protein